MKTGRVLLTMSCALLFSDLAAAGLSVPLVRRTGRVFHTNSPLVSRDVTVSSRTQRLIHEFDRWYTIDVSLNGQTFALLLDTGSADLWVESDTGADLGSYNDTKIPAQIEYGIGFASGDIGVAPVSCLGLTVEKQAFLKVNQSSGIPTDGILGLSFTTLSVIDKGAKQMDGASATWGRTFLQNLFDQHPDLPRFLAIDLARSDEPDDVAGGLLSVGEYHTAYASVQSAPKLYSPAKHHSYWNVVLQGITVDGQQLPLHSPFIEVPPGQLYVALDTGSSDITLPTDILDAILSKIPGGIKWKYEVEGRNPVKYFLPCNTTTVVEFMFGGQTFAINPIDLSRIVDPVDLPDGTKAVSCVSTFTGVENRTRANHDLLIGIPFLRNVYSLYHFGDRPGDEPYVQLLSQTRPEEAKSQAAMIRAKAMASLPREIPPIELAKLFCLQPDGSEPESCDNEYSSGRSSALPTLRSPSLSQILMVLLTLYMSLSNLH